jgi:hypothetical protein
VSGYVVVSFFRPHILFCFRKVASGFARSSTPAENEPKGFHEHNKELMLTTWMFNCKNFHKHSEGERLPFVNPFEETILASSSSLPPGLKSPSKSSASTARVDVAELNREARPFSVPTHSHTSSAFFPAAPPASSPKPRSASPSKQCSPSSSSRRAEAAKPSYVPLNMEYDYYAVRYAGGADLYCTR